MSTINSNLRDWLVGENESDSTADVHLRGSIAIVRASIVCADEPRKRTSTTYPAMSIQLLTKGRLSLPTWVPDASPL